MPYLDRHMAKQLTSARRDVEHSVKCVRNVLETSSDTVTKSCKELCPIDVRIVWREPHKTIQLYFLVLVLPCEGIEGTFCISVSEDGMLVKFKVDWLNALCHLEFLHRRWL